MSTIRGAPLSTPVAPRQEMIERIEPPKLTLLSRAEAGEAWLPLPRLRGRIDPTSLLASEISQALVLSAFVLYCRGYEFVTDGRAATHGEAPGLTVEEAMTLTGLRKPVQTEALEGLARGGIARTDAGRWLLAPDVIQPDPQRTRVRWDQVLHTLAGDGSALLLIWAFAELIAPPWTLMPVTRRELESLTRLSVGTIRQAERRLIAAGLIERIEGPLGSTPQFVFSAVALGTATGVQAPAKSEDAMQQTVRSGSGPADSATLVPLLLRFLQEGPPVDMEIRHDEAGRPIWRVGDLEIRPRDPE